MAFSDTFGQPFHFQPEGGDEVAGRAFSLPFRGLSIALVGGAIAWGVQLWRTGLLGQPAGSGSGATSGAAGYWLIAALVLMAITVYHILRSQTCLSSQHLRQSWIWDKEMRVSELAYAKLIRIRGLDWLMAPRLYARSQGGQFATFYSADAKVLEQFERLCIKLAQERMPR